MQMDSLVTGRGYLGTPDEWITSFGMYFNVDDYGAVGDGVTDDRLAVQAAINAAVAAGGGVVFVPNRDYACAAISGVTDIFLMSGAGAGKVVFLGCGRASSITMTGNGQGSDKVLFHVRDGCKYVGFRRLQLRSTLTNEAEQEHLILFENRGASADLLTGRSWVVDCYFGQVRGDAVRFLGNDTKRVAEILCRRNVFEMYRAGHRSRSAFQFQRAADDITIDCCYASEDSSAIDFEPTGIGSNERMRIDRNIFVGQCSLTGNGSLNEHTKSSFSYNTMIGSIDALDIERFIAASNIIDHMGVVVGEGCLTIFERIHDVIVCDNIMFRQNDTASLSPFSIDYHSASENYTAVVDGNMVVNNCDVGDGGAMSFRHANEIVVTDNMCLLAVNVASKGTAIRFEGTTEDAKDAVLRGNLCMGIDQVIKYGLSIAGVSYGDAVVADNLVQHAANGLIASGTRTGQHMAARNMFATSVAGIAGIVDYIVISGSGAKGPSTYLCAVAAEGNIPAALGSVAVRTVGGGANTTIATKKTEPTPSTGWVTF